MSSSNYSNILGINFGKKVGVVISFYKKCGIIERFGLIEVFRQLVRFHF